ncbi:MAG: acetolactate synthase small subunit [Fimbriimonadaceae bacterium]
MSVRQHAVTCLVQNEAGTINRLVSTFRRRGFSLASFNAGDCEQPGFSRLTLVLNADDAQLAFCLKQLKRLIDVVEVEDLAPDDRIMREVALVSFDPGQVDREKVLAVASEYEAKVEYDQEHCLVLQYTGPVRLVEQYLRALQAFPVLEIVRSGPVALKVAR